MTMWKKLWVLLFLTTVYGFSAVVEWTNKPVKIKVPQYSVLTIEVPCTILNVAHLSLVQSAFSVKKKAKAVHISVGEDPTSVGITCEEKGITKSYNIYIVPSRGGGTTYLKIEDKHLTALLRRTKEEVKGSKEDSSILNSAKSLLRAMLLGKGLFGYTVEEGSNKYEDRGVFFRELLVYKGLLLGQLYEIKNVSPMKVELHPSFFTDRGVVLVWLQGTERKNTVVLRPGESALLAVIRTNPNNLGLETEGSLKLPVR